jgi:regulatory protein
MVVFVWVEGRDAAMPGSVVTALEVQKRDKTRVNVYLDDEFAFGLSLDEAAKLRKGQILDEAQIQALRAEDEVQRAVDSAARYLSYRPRSTHEVRKNLREKAFPDAVIEQAMIRLEKLGYLDDQAFARLWVRERNTFKPVSPKALRYELRQKGLADATIQDALAEVDADDVAFRAAASQAKRYRGKTRGELRDKLLPFLQRRGFSYASAKSAYSRLLESLEEEGDFFVEDVETSDDLRLPDSDD